MALKKLGDMNFSHLKVDRDSSDDEVESALLDDLQKAGKVADVVITITTAKSGHSDTTTTGTKSRHGFQTAVDIALLDGISAKGATNASNGSSEFREKGNKIKDALVAMGYVWNVERGNDKAVLWQTDTGGNHYNHLHVSNKSGKTSEIDPKIDIKIDSAEKDGKKKDSTDLFAKFSQEEKDKMLGDLLATLYGENKDEVDKILSETTRIKNLMK